MASDFKTIVQRGLGNATFDARSPIDDIVPGSFRFKQNLSVSPDGKLGRALGWERLFNHTCPKNLDWHDKDGLSEPLTMLFPSVSNEGVRWLFGATKSRILVANEQTETWDVIGSGFGADGSAILTQVRFHAAELQNQVVFTNNFDLPKIHTLGDPDVVAIPSLSLLGGGDVGDTDELTAAKVVVDWQGFVFLMNTVEDGDRYASRIRWCHLNTPFRWEGAGLDLGGDLGVSLADFQDITYGDEILNAIPQGGYLYVFTNKGIERISLSVNVDAVLDQPIVSLTPVSMYREPDTQARCPAYPNAIVGDGTSFWFAGRDAIYRFTPGQDSEPERVEWVHRSTSVIFKGMILNGESTRIDKGACESPIMEFHPANNDDDTAGGEIHFSWPSYQPLSVPPPPGTVDCATYEAPDAIPGFGVNDHTLVIVNRKSADPTLRQQATDYRDYGSTALVNFRSDKQGVGACNQAVTFISADGEDWCLKELDVGAGREMFDAITGLYTMRGYYSILRGVYPFETFDKEKEIQGFLIEHEAVDPNDPAVFRLRIGSSDQAIDPNPNGNGQCKTLWMQLRNIPIKCQRTMTPDEYVLRNIKPENPVTWSVLARGRYLAYELTISAADNSAPTTGACSLSHFEVSARLV